MSLTKVTYSMIDQAPANVLDYGADPTGVADSTTAIENAIATGRRVRIPAGTYKCNVQVDKKTIIEGDGSLETILKPFNNAIAVMTYTYTAMLDPSYQTWDYHSEVRNVGFVSNSAMTGVGFTFGQTNPADYQTNDEYANNVKFYGCYFRGFDKGLQFPFGNIGTEIYSCGFKDNKYGVYTLNNKFGALMHAGCKYFFGGEFSGNTVAIYINNAAADGFGGITLTGTIIEGNQIGIYAFISPRVKDPIMLDGVWFENNGATRASPGTSVIDAWSGSTRSNQTVTDKTVIIDGAQSKINFHSMFVCDIHIKATNAEVVATGCRVEASPGFGGASFLVDYPETSYIRLENPYTDGGWYASGTYMPYVTGMGTNPATLLGAAAQLRCFQTNARGSKVTNYGPSLAMATPLTSAASTSGSFGLTGSVVSDGRIYNQCNEFTRSAFASNQFTRISTPDTLITTSAGWYVFTLDAKVVSGAGVRINVWDRAAAQLVASARVNKIGYWQTFAAVGYSAGSQTLYLDFSGNDGDVTWRVSAYQIHRFDTQQEAFMFLQSNVFAES